MPDEGNLTLLDCTVRDNAAEHETRPATDPGPLAFDTCVALGGGIVSGFGSLTLDNSTVMGNSADVGGGILKFGSESLTVTNTTVSGNTANEAGGIENGPGGRLIVTNSTMSGNTVAAIRNYGAATVMNSLIDGVCAEPQEPLISLGYNIESPGNACGFDQTGDQSGVSADNLNLGALANNGGPTMTHALGLLLTPSVAIDQIPVVDCEVSEDQRGVARPQGPACDVGAFELEVAP